jgi:hypothetical protein
MVVSLVARATAKCLRTLNEKDLGEKFPEVSDSVAALDVQDAVIDDEIVAQAKKRWGRLSSCCRRTTWAKRMIDFISLCLWASGTKKRAEWFGSRRPRTIGLGAQKPFSEYHYEMERI